MVLWLCLLLGGLALPSPSSQQPYPPRRHRHLVTNGNHVAATGHHHHGEVLLPFSVGDDGGMQVPVGALSATITSSFTSQSELCAFGHTPYGEKGGWSLPVSVDRSGAPGRVRVLGVGQSFSVDRLIVSAQGRLLVNDTIKIIRADMLGNATAVQQSHSATFGAGVNYTSVDGPNNESPDDCISGSVGMYGSPSVFVAAQEKQRGSDKLVGVGLLALDDVFSLHARAVNAAVNTGLLSRCRQTSPSPSVSLQDRQFGMRGPSEHTVEWAVYATGGCATSDPFWCFSNAVRHDLGVNSLRIGGNGILNAMRWGDRLAPLGYTNAKEWRQWSPQKMGEFLDTNAFDWVASDIPWNRVNNLGTHGNLCEPGNPHYEQGSGFVTEAGVDYDQYIRDLVKAVKTARPKVRVLVYFHGK
jgi:hypothetical protein